VPILHFVFPGDPETLTGGYLYDRRIVEGLSHQGWTVIEHTLGPGFPTPDAETIANTGSLFAGIPDGALVVVDGLAFGALPDVARAYAERIRLVALVHHPLADETGLTPDVADRLRESERSALECAHMVIATSPTTARALAEFGVAAEDVVVVRPGTDPVPVHCGSGEEAPALLCVATLTPRKGHVELLDALARHRDALWRLTCVGGAEHDPIHAARIRRTVERLNLTDRVVFEGEVAPGEIGAHYDRADLFVLASFHEGYGMALAEALARALPIVSTTAGAIPETVPAEAGILVPPGDPEALAAALGKVLDDPDTIARLRAGARHARVSLPRWDESVGQFAAALERVPS
jgi:glycosyltransferase involved in cell wall biosynthesis